MENLSTQSKSTTVRASNVNVQPIKAGLKLLSGISPGLAAQAAGRLFCTPRRFAPRATESRFMGEASPFPIRMGLKNLRGWRWGEGPAVLLAHGWEGRAGQMSEFVPGLLEAGFSVVAWDAPGHGKSPGKRSSLVEFSDAIWAAGRAAGDVHGIIAHSMGASAAGLAMHEGLPVKRATFIAPPFQMLTYSDQFAELLGLSDAVHERMLRTMERRFKVRFADLSFGAIKSRGKVPCQVIHDRDDKEVPFELGQRVAKAWPHAELHATEGLGHKRILAAPDVIRRVVRFMKREELT